VSQDMQLSGERRDEVYDRLVKPHHDQLVPLIREAVAAGAGRLRVPGRRAARTCRR
jgi:hypothetical protein